MACVVVISGGSKGECLPLGRRISVIGRAENLPLQVLDDLVSRKHLRIAYDATADGYWAEDIGSRHGVFINGRKVAERTVLVDGDEILIGETMLLFATKDFDDLASALSHYKKAGERSKPTRMQ
jgi:pSer/pThr/pTyr-binding forkhead associated (FHA) protein